VGGIEYHSLPPALSYQRICFKMQKISDLLYVRKNFLNEFDKETHPDFPSENQGLSHNLNKVYKKLVSQYI